MNFTRPTELGGALELLRDDNWTILAGGTDYFPSLRSEAPRGAVLDISAIAELGGVTITDNEIRIGALATWTDIVNASLPSSFIALQQASREVGSVQIQNRATMVGNLCNASPAADGVPPLLILNAVVELQSHRGVRSVPLSDFIAGNRRTLKSNDELVSAVVIPKASCDGSSVFCKLGARRYLVISIGMVAARVVINQEQITELAVAVGSCSEVAKRLTKVETLLTGKRVSSDPVALIQSSHLSELSPINDIRSSADYRMTAATELVKRTIAKAIEKST